jgi:hypothetical protein
MSLFEDEVLKKCYYIKFKYFAIGKIFLFQAEKQREEKRLPPSHPGRGRWAEPKWTVMRMT